MHQLPIEQQILLIVEIAALVALAIRMWLTGLHKVYVNFFRYLILEFAQALIPIFVPVQSMLYRDLFVVSEALIVGYYAFVVLELYSVILRDLQGVAAVARRYIKITLGFAILLSLLPLLVEKPPSTLTGYLFMFERPVLSTAIGCVLLIGVFLLYYPVPLGRNAMLYLVGYAIYFPTIATTEFINNLGYFWNRQKSNVEMGVTAVCMLFWLFCLDRRGEEKNVVVGHQWNLNDERRLMTQLETINAGLLRSVRRNSTLQNTPQDIENHLHSSK